MKKLFAGILALCMAVGFGATCFAQTLGKEQPAGASLIRTSYEEGDIQYAVQIPADTVIPWAMEQTALTYTPTLMRLEQGKKVTVSVSGQNGALRQSSADAANAGIPYALNGAVAAEFFHGQAGAGYAQEVLVNITAAAWDAAAMGSYQDRVMFTIAYVEA